MEGEGTKVDPRIIFAAERTLLAWIRTGLSLMGFGFVVARFGLFLRELAAVRTPVQHPSFSLWFGIFLVAIGVAVNVIAIVQHASVVRRLRSGQTVFEARVSPAVPIAAALALLGIGFVAYLFTLK